VVQVTVGVLFQNTSKQNTCASYAHLLCYWFSFPFP